MPKEGQPLNARPLTVANIVFDASDPLFNPSRRDMDGRMSCTSCVECCYLEQRWEESKSRL